MGLITVRDLCRTGRAGNQLFLYAFAKAYALHYGCELQIPANWWGREVFENVTEKPIPPRTYLSQTILDSRGHRPLGYFFGETDIDIHVYGQHQKYLNFYTRAQVREWFKLKEEIQEEYSMLEEGPYTALHIRHGDYLSHPVFSKLYCAVSLPCYYRALEKFNINPPVHIVKEGTRLPSAVLERRGLGWLQDWISLRDAAVLFRANSSFSVWAGWLGNGRVFSPVVGKRTGLCDDVEFVEGNHANPAPNFENQSDLHLKEV